ncbi:MAG: formyltetrahydrofolate deformylase [Planctomycetes bacterium]|nr:formyltetrahydrofolate deformylase [Planctomycetota bacterium]
MSPAANENTASLLVSCRDRTGLVATLSNFVFRNGGNIVDLDQHTEHDSGLFLMRLVWSLQGFALDRAGIERQLQAFSSELGLQWTLTYGDRRPRVAVFVSQTAHCLYDLLLRRQLGDLRCDIAAVVSNHSTLAGVAAHFDVPFEHHAITPETKQAVEDAQQRRLDELGIDLVVLARYMQILSPAFVDRWRGRIINIHHSFLPAFIGAKPYHQAWERGVKIIGATAHYVTADLDQGPIIEQDVARVSHRDDVEELVRKGRDLERQVLSRAVRLHLERRVLISGNRTIVFG